MLSLERCRKILGDRSKNLSDEQVAVLRDSLYSAVNLIFDNLQKKEMKKNEQYQNENVIPATI
jgi:hypothetical protein